jgi:hypothetical protein
MVQSALVGFLVPGTFVDNAYFDVFYYVVAILIVLKGRRQAAEHAASPALRLPGHRLRASALAEHQ